MEDLQFSEEQDYTTPVYGESRQTGIIAWLIDKNIVDNEQQAYYISLGFVVLIIIVTFFIYIFSGSNEGYEQKGVPVDQFIPG
jgi:hypothetical protein